MEVILILFASMLGLGYALSPIIAFFMALGAGRKADALEKTVKSQKQELAQLRAELGALARGVKAGAETPPMHGVAPAAASATAAPPAYTAPPPEPARSQPTVIVTDAKASVAAPAPLAATSPADDIPVEATPAVPAASTSAPVSASSTTADAPVQPTSTPTPAPAKPQPRVPAPPSAAAILFSRAKEWLFGGNLVAKIGLLILFIGVSFLLKYAAARVSVPIELRLAGVVLADIALLIWGWRIREKRPGIALPVQGASLAILMLVTFGAFKMYNLIPGSLAFAMLFALTGFTCLLAVLQNALWLAIFGIAGGFAAPILTSTGQGSHIALFSYYALLNAGIFGIALKRSWRSLNLIGFVFTFLIGTAWGVTKYVPENYQSSQAFLILFFLFYVAIAIVYAARQAPQLKHYVDGTLVFGTPLVAFGLQYGLVKDVKFGLAFSALALGLFYISLTLVLWRKRGTTLKLLAEAFFALGIVFGTLAIPFALDGRWTSAAWALEGAGIVWVGLRQRQTMAWMFGLLVQAGAWISFLASVSGLDATAAAQSNLWLGFLLLAATAFLMATNFRAQAAQADTGSRFGFGPFATAFLALASIWFVAGAWTEIWMRTSGALQATLLVTSALLAATGLGFIARRMQWQVARYFALVVQVVAGLTLFVLAIVQLDWPFDRISTNLLDSPFLGALMIGAAAFFSSRVFCRQAQEEGKNGSGWLPRALLLWSGFWWYGLILYTFSGWVATHYLIFIKDEAQRNFSIWLCAYAIGLALTGPLLARLAQRLDWRDLRWSALPNWLVLALASGMMLVALYGDEHIPAREIWIAYAALLLAGEWLMRFWLKQAWPLSTIALRALHTVRTVAPWLMIWPVGYDWIARWLHGGTEQEQQLLHQAGWFTSGSWARYLPVWVMMAAIAWVMQRTRAEGWPVKPIAPWYRQVLIPLGTAWSIVLVVIWNLTQNGSMAPLPYLPLLNPLDLSTCFALLLGLASYRLIAARAAAPVTEAARKQQASWIARLWLGGFVAAYAWFNLVLLRTVAHWLNIPYQFDLLFASQFVQAMLSLVWSATALILMRRAVRQVSRNQWIVGAVLLALVVVKLFFVDLSNVGGVERIISFVGVGLLMVAIGYLAPYPAQAKKDDAAKTDAAVTP